MHRVLLVVALLSPVWPKAQTLPEVLREAEVNYPLLKVKAFEVQARRDQVSLAKNNALPTLDATYQINYATYNNITGMATAQGFVPISGPPSASNEYSGVFGSAAGLMMNWDPFTFGQRKAAIQSAGAGQSFQEADEANERFQHKIQTANAYFDLLLADELIKVYEQNLQRANDQARIIKALARSGLRPATDTAAVHADLASAKIELLNQKRFREIHQARLAELMGVDLTSFTGDTRYVLSLPIPPVDSGATQHPLVVMQTSRMAIHQKEKDYLNRTLFPKLSVWGTAYARGSGIQWDGTVNRTEGLGFSRYNYGAGLVLTVPVLRFSSVRPQVQSQESLIKADEERINVLKLQINKQQKIAKITLSNALEIARENPALHQSADFSYRAIVSRYNSGLSNYAELVQAQFVLLKSEVELRKSHLEAWKALLFLAAAQGDLAILLDQLN